MGIAWVVECVEKRTRVDETRFLVDLALANVAGVNRVRLFFGFVRLFARVVRVLTGCCVQRRKSMLPKSIFASPGADGKTVGGAGAAASPASSDSSFRASGPPAGMGMRMRGGAGAGDRSVEVSSRGSPFPFCLRAARGCGMLTIIMGA